MVPVATYSRLQLQSPATGTTTTGTTKKNNIKALWGRLNQFMNNPKNFKKGGSPGSGPFEVLVVNANMKADRANTPLAKSQAMAVLTKVTQLTQYWKLPVILMGDWKLAKTHSLYRTAFNRLHHIKNTLDKTTNAHAYPTARRYMMNNVVDYVKASKLKTVFSATVTDRLPTQRYMPAQQKPILAVFAIP